MSYTRGSGNSRGSSSGSRGRGGYTGYRNYDQGPPAEMTPLGHFLHATEGDMLCVSTNPKIPYFNAPVFLENKTQIGKVDEILGAINQVMFTVKVGDGVVASSFKGKEKVWIGSDKLLPLERFLPKPPAPKVKRSKGSGVGKAPSRGGRGGFSRGGSSRGGFGRGGRGGSFPSRGSSFRGSSSRGGFSRGPSRGGRGGY